MPPLTITASCGHARPPQKGSPPETVAELADAAIAAARAGAAIVQVRVPLLRVDPADGKPRTELKTWIEMAKRIRGECDVLIHAGVAAMPVEERAEMLETIRPEFASFLLGHHDIVVRGHDLNSLRRREESERLAAAHVRTGVCPDFEVFGSGSYWRLQDLLSKVPVPRPLAMTLFFGWEGGEWSPPTAEELLHRLRLIPANAHWSITVSGPEQTALHALAMARGGHVRVGLGDYPYFTEGRFADSNAQMVQRVVRVAAELDRPVAKPQEVARAFGLTRGGVGR
jgi:3-keto-5-aminohexanoate cleavage enzyme